MRLTADQVTAVIPTRGDVPAAIDEIRASLPYEDVVVWDNSKKANDLRAYGRYVAASHASGRVIYFQDDDILFTQHDKLLAAYEPGLIVCNMPSPWYETNGYPKFGQCMVGAGSLCDRDLYVPAIDAYLRQWPADALFLSYVDEVVGMLVPHTRLNLGYHILPHASAPGRTYTLPGASEKKELMRERALALRG